MQTDIYADIHHLVITQVSKISQEDQQSFLRNAEFANFISINKLNI